MAGKIKASLSDKEKEAYKTILATAHQQLNKIGKVMPEGLDALKKHPGMNPVGYYSEIDMGFAERMKRCDNAVRLKNFLVWTEYTDLKKRIEEHPKYAKMKEDIIKASQKMRMIDRALRLCKDDNVRKALEEDKKELQNAPVLKEFDTLMKTFEAYSGVKLVHREIPDNIEREKYEFEMRKLCLDKFGIQVGVTQFYDPHHQTDRFVNPKSLEIEFENLDDIMQCQRMVTDENMGKSWDEVEKAPLKDNEFRSYASAVPSYMQASCDRVLDSALPEVKDRADYILIDGVSVREQMKAQEGIENPNEEQIKRYSSLYVAAALRQGRYVETFTKDYTVDGNFINHKPVPIVAKGEDSTILKKNGDNELENITIGFLDRILAKLGFSKYKEKVEKVEKIKQGREAFRKAHTPQKEGDSKRLAGQTMKAPSTQKEIQVKKDTLNLLQKHKDDFLKFREETLRFTVKGNYLRKQFFPNGKPTVINEATGREVKRDREELFTFAIVRMLQKGYSLDDILDTSKYAEKKAEFAQEVIKELRTCDEKRFFDMHLEVTDVLDEHFEKFAKEHNVSCANISSVFQEPIILEIALGAGNVPDIFMKAENKETVERLYGEGIAEKINEKTDAWIINGRAENHRAQLARSYNTLADGQYLGRTEFMTAIRSAVDYKVFAKLEEQTGKVYAHPISAMELIQIENAVLAHPNVEKFFKETPQDKLVEIMAQEKLLDAMKMDFELLPSKQVPGVDLNNEKFLIEIPKGFATPTNFVPTFNGKSDFYQMTDPEMLNDMEL